MLSGVVSKRIPFFAMTSAGDGVFFTGAGYAQGYASYKVTGEGAQIYGSWPAFMKHLQKHGMEDFLHSLATAAVFRAHGGFGGHFERGSYAANLRVAREQASLAMYRSIGSLAERLPRGSRFAQTMRARAAAIETRRKEIAAGILSDLQAQGAPEDQLQELTERALTFTYDTDHRRWGVPEEVVTGGELPAVPNWDLDASQSSAPKVHGIQDVEVRPEDVDTPF
jgi:hypothetical protein